jgi:chromosome segregation ATPase
MLRVAWGDSRREALAVNEYLATENERLREQVRRDAEEFDELRLKRDEVIRERDHERSEAQARLDEAIQRAEKAEARAAELDGLRRERDDERREANAMLDELGRRAEEAEARVAALEAELGEGVLGRLRALCRGVRTTLQTHWPGGESR